MPTHHAAPRFARRAEHAVVYRRDNHFASHPYVRGFWETAAGDLVTNFSVATVDYRGDPLALSHLSLVRSTGGRRAVTMRSEDRGLTWHIVNEDPRRPSNDVMAPRPGVDGLPGGLPELGRVDFTDRDVLVSVFNHQYMNEDPAGAAVLRNAEQHLSLRCASIVTGPATCGRMSTRARTWAAPGASCRGSVISAHPPHRCCLAMGGS